MDIYMSILKSYTKFVESNNLTRKASIPIISSFETDGNPRISKIGGKFPYLENETIPECPKCHEIPMMVAQLYVPTLPDYIQRLFPESLQKSLVVLSVCPSCLGSEHYCIHTYDESQLDNLIYHDDVGEKWATPQYNMMRIFNFQPNSPQTYDAIDQQKQYLQFNAITGWKDTEMVPYASVDEVKNLMKGANIEPNNRVFLIAHEINMKNEISGNSYLGGWPHFCQEDQTPKGYQILLNLCESPAATLEWGNGGTAQLWIGINENEGKFKFTCSTH